MSQREVRNGQALQGSRVYIAKQNKLECGPMPNLMVALPNIGGAFCSTRKVWLTPTTRCRAITLPRRKPR